VTFTPSAVGNRTASLNFPDNAAGSPQTVSLSGAGTSSGVSLSTTSLNFNNQTVGTTSAAGTVTLTNSGTANLTISTVTITGTNAGDFAKSADSCSGATVTPNGACSVSVTFTPSAVGNRTASLNFPDNAAGSPQTVSLAGTGATAVLSGVTLTGLPATSAPDQQYSSFAVTLSSPASTQLSGTLQMSFTPDPSVKNWNPSYISAQFDSACANATAGNPPPNPCNLNFTIAQNASSASVALQVGTVAGTITVTLTALSANGTSVLPPSPVSTTVTVSAPAPAITGSVTIVPLNGGGFDVEVDNAYSATRDLVSASFIFSGAGLTGNTQFSNVSLASAAANYFSGTSSLPNGGSFQLTVPFTYQGDTSVLDGTSVTVTITSSMGTSTAATGGVQ
jgi:hypothetical protein